MAAAWRQALLALGIVALLAVGLHQGLEHVGLQDMMRAGLLAFVFVPGGLVRARHAGVQTSMAYTPPQMPPPVPAISAPVAPASGAPILLADGETAPIQRTLYDFTVKDIKGKDVALSDYRELEELYERYQPKGFEILAFPCNQFGEQEPGTNDEIEEFAKSKLAKFKLFSKIDVNGDTEAPLYGFLKNTQRKVTKRGELVDAGKRIRWNFEKFLVNRNGECVKRFGSQENPLSFEKEIAALL